ncbi:hypothetical protein BB560_000160 [Smittium megazygosporum]|uniref:PDZ domain-containing protein n=1 Tax=Smittium megazygosporum TaxID=133381 RepID=A0A2T9ZL99_9FUNG|nr:hypothetical protein BB560_000160 [Smittium megazygosporum]
MDSTKKGPRKERTSSIDGLHTNASSFPSAVEDISHYNMKDASPPKASVVRQDHVSSEAVENYISPSKDTNNINDDFSVSALEDGTVVARRPSRKISSSSLYQRKKSLAQSDLMAVFFYPNIVRQPTITEVPFEPKELEGHEALGSTDSEVSLKMSWEPTLERAIKSIVSIKANCVRSFDTETSGTYTATGFVVDAKRGIVLSNRHVVNPAPIVATGVFTNYEEVELMPIYYDPVHDFGFFKFDPSKLKFMDVSEISLAPHKAKVGMEIRVVGNDAGEKLSILAGTLARLDRNAPDYGSGEYNDFNTFYLQAASGTSGGSSGSPVLDIYGDAVALNAGGSNKASSSYYLPLNRVVAALKHIQQGKCVPRGTIQTELEHLPYDELRRLGLTLEIEKSMRERYPRENGMLCVKNVLPKGPADQILHAGDIVVALNGIPVSNFIMVSSELDTSVGNIVKLTILRCKKAYIVECKVQDLYEITPSRFVEVAGGVVNDLSYQFARSYSIPAAGVYVAASGQMLGSASVWRGSIVLSINHTPTNNLDDLIKVIGTLKAGSRVPVKYITLDQQHREKLMIMNVVCHWHPFRLATRSRETGLWEYTDLKKPDFGGQIEPQTVKFPKFSNSMRLASLIWSSMVSIDFHIPYLIDGMTTTQFYGPGYVIDKEKGLILCDRDTVPISMGDLYVTFAQSLVITAKIFFLHPVYNFTIIQYNPKLLGETLVQELVFSEDYYSGKKRLDQGDPVVLVATGNDQNHIVRRTIVSSRSILSTRECAPPRWRSTNTEGIYLEDQPSCQGGVLCDEDGKVQSLWVNFSTQDSKHNESSFMAGIDPSTIRPVIESLKTGVKLNIYSLDLELWTVKPAAARSLGLSNKRMIEMQEKSHIYSNFYYVLSILNKQSQSSKLIKAGDLILELDGKFVTDVSQVAVIYDKSSVQITVLRDGNELELTVTASELPIIETERIIGWSGSIIQEPYRAVLEQVKSLPSNVYVTCTLFGSPASSYGLKPGVWITHVEGRPVSDISSFLREIKKINKTSNKVQGLGETDTDKEQSSIESGYTRLNVVNKVGFSKVISIKLDEHYWPSMEISRDQNSQLGWFVDFNIG